MVVDVKTCSIYWCTFSWYKPNYDNLNNMKLDKNVSTTKVNLVQVTRAFSLKISVITGLF